MSRTRHNRKFCKLQCRPTRSLSVPSLPPRNCETCNLMWENICLPRDVATLALIVASMELSPTRTRTIIEPMVVVVAVSPVWSCIYVPDVDILGFVIATDCQKKAWRKEHKVFCGKGCCPLPGTMTPGGWPQARLSSWSSRHDDDIIIRIIMEEQQQYSLGKEGINYWFALVMLLTAPIKMYTLCLRNGLIWAKLPTSWGLRLGSVWAKRRTTEGTRRTQEFVVWSWIGSWDKIIWALLLIILYKVMSLYSTN